MGRFIEKVSNMVSSNQMRVNYLAINCAGKVAPGSSELWAVLWMQAKGEGNFMVSGTTFVLR